MARVRSRSGCSRLMTHLSQYHSPLGIDSRGGSRHVVWKARSHPGTRTAAARVSGGGVGGWRTRRGRGSPHHLTSPPPHLTAPPPHLPPHAARVEEPRDPGGLWAAAPSQSRRRCSSLEREQMSHTAASLKPRGAAAPSPPAVPPPPAQPCGDIKPTSFCDANEYKCNQPWFQRNCALTCGQCVDESPSPPTGCECSDISTGCLSGDVDVSERCGCSTHSLAGEPPFCYVVEPTLCPTATASTWQPGAIWVDCASCPETLCTLWCEHGNELDSNGCQLCSCLDAAPPPP